MSDQFTSQAHDEERITALVEEGDDIGPPLPPGFSYSLQEGPSEGSSTDKVQDRVAYDDDNSEDDEDDVMDNNVCGPTYLQVM